MIRAVRHADPMLSCSQCRVAEKRKTISSQSKSSVTELDLERCSSCVKNYYISIEQFRISESPTQVSPCSVIGFGRTFMTGYAIPILTTTDGLYPEPDLFGSSFSIYLPCDVIFLRDLNKLQTMHYR